MLFFPASLRPISKETPHLGRAILKGYALYFKEASILPGMELAASALIRRLTDFGSPYKDLIRIKGKPYMVFSGTPGESLSYVLQQDHALLQDLEPASLSQMLLTSMVVTPALGISNNYIVEPLLQEQEIYRGFSHKTPNLFGFSRHLSTSALLPKTSTASAPTSADSGSELLQSSLEIAENWRDSILQEEARGYRLVSLDDEFAFATPGIGPSTGVNVLFCLDAMQHPVADVAREALLKLDINYLLQKWLRRISDTNVTLQQLFSKTEQQDLLTATGALVGVAFSENMLKMLYERLQLLQEALQRGQASSSNKPLTHLQVLARLDPVLAAGYRGAFAQYPDIADRVSWYEETLVPKIRDRIHWGQQYLQDLLGISDIEMLINNLRQGGSYSPDAALLNLSSLITPQTTTNPESLLTLPTRQAREIAVKVQDFKEMNAITQQAWVNALQATLSPARAPQELAIALRSLLLSGADFAAKLISQTNLNFVTHLQIQHTNLSSKFFLLLAQACPGVIELKVAHCFGFKRVGEQDPYNLSGSLLLQGQQVIKSNEKPKSSKPKYSTLRRGVGRFQDKFSSQQEGILSFAALEKLNLSDNPNLQQIMLHAPQLQQLNLNQCRLLETVVLNTPELQSLQLNGTPKMQTTAALSKLLLALNALEMLQLDLPELPVGHRTSIPPNYIWQHRPQTSLAAWQSIKPAAQQQILATLNNEAQKWQFVSGQLGAGKNESLRPEVFKLLTLALKGNTSLTRLSLSFQNLTSDQANALFTALKDHPQLQQLELQNNPLHDQGMQELPDLNAAVIRSLDLQDIHIKQPAGLAVFLSQAIALEELNLSHNPLGNVGLQSLLQGWSQIPNLHTLNLTSLQLGSSGAKVLGKALKRMPQLTTLLLSDNTIGNKGVKHLGAGLRYNQMVHTLDLSNNNIIGGEGLAWLLAPSNHLSALRIASNPLGASGVQALIANLASHPRLLQLDLSKTQLQIEKAQADLSGVLALAQALTHNKVIEEIRMRDNKLSKTAMHKLLKALKYNHILQELRVGEIASDQQEQLQRLLQRNQKGRYLNRSLRHQRFEHMNWEQREQLRHALSSQEESQPAAENQSVLDLPPSKAIPDFLTEKVWRAAFHKQTHAFYAKTLLTPETLPLYLGVDLTDMQPLQQASYKTRALILPLAKQDFIQDQWPASLCGSIYWRLRQQYQRYQGSDLTDIEDEIASYCKTKAVFTGLMQHYLAQGRHLEAISASATDVSIPVSQLLLQVLAESYGIKLQLWQATDTDNLTRLYRRGSSSYQNLLAMDQGYCLLADAKQPQALDAEPAAWQATELLSVSRSLERAPYLGISLQGTPSSLLGNALLLHELEQRLQNYTVQYHLHEVFDVVSSFGCNSLLALGCTLATSSQRLWSPSSWYSWEQHFGSTHNNWPATQLTQALQPRLQDQLLSQTLTEVILPIWVQPKKPSGRRHKKSLSAQSTPIVLNSRQAKAWANFDFKAIDLIKSGYSAEGLCQSANGFSFSNANNTAAYTIAAGVISDPAFSATGLGINRLQQLTEKAAPAPAISWLSLGGQSDSSATTNLNISHLNISHYQLNLSSNVLPPLSQISNRRDIVGSYTGFATTDAATAYQLSSSQDAVLLNSLDDLARYLTEQRAQQWEVQ